MLSEWHTPVLQHSTQTTSYLCNVMYTIGVCSKRLSWTYCIMYICTLLVSYPASGALLGSAFHFPSPWGSVQHGPIPLPQSNEAAAPWNLKGVSFHKAVQSIHDMSSSSSLCICTVVCCVLFNLVSATLCSLWHGRAGVWEHTNSLDMPLTNCRFV